MRRVRALLLAVTLASAACSSTGGLFRQYEYEEEVYLSLDGTATVYVNASLAALNALHGTSFDTSPNAPFDREKVRQMYTTPVTHVAATPKTSRRAGRRFVHVRLDVDDIRALSQAAPFSWSTYELTREGERYVFRQEVRKASGRQVANVGWTGRELVAFRLHLPSEILSHNAGAGNPKRGNILAWEQLLGDRQRSQPLVLEARIKGQSILYRTLWLFAATFGVVVVMFALMIWWILRRAPATPNPEPRTENQGSRV